MKKVTTFAIAVAIASSSLFAASKTATDTKIFAGKKNVEFTMQEDLAVGEFSKIGGVAINPKDYLIVAGTRKVVVYSPKGKKVKEFSTDIKPSSCCTDEKGNIYLGTKPTKTVKAKIYKYSPKGEFIKEWNEIAKGTIMSATGMECHDETLYVSDTYLQCIHKFDLDGKSIGTIGKMRDLTKKGKYGEFATCCGILDFGINKTDGSIHIANLGRHKVSCTKNGKSFKDWGKYGKKEDDFCGCCNPTNLTVTQNGYIVTSEKTIPRIKVYDKKGKKMLAIMGTDVFDKGCGNLDITVDSKCNIYAIDSKKNCVRKFSPAPAKK